MFCISDLSKSSDSFSHDIITNKLKLYAIQNMNPNLLKSYLENRKQMVVVGKETSDLKSIPSGFNTGTF